MYGHDVFEAIGNWFLSAPRAFVIVVLAGGGFAFCVAVLCILLAITIGVLVFVVSESLPYAVAYGLSLVALGLLVYFMISKDQ